MLDMEGKIKATAILINPDGVWEEEMPLEFVPGKEQAALVQFIGMIANGLIRFLGNDELEFIPPQRIKSINLKLNTVTLATTADMPKAPLGGKIFPR